MGLSEASAWRVVAAWPFSRAIVAFAMGCSGVDGWKLRGQHRKRGSFFGRDGGTVCGCGEVHGEVQALRCRLHARRLESEGVCAAGEGRGLRCAGDCRDAGQQRGRGDGVGFERGEEAHGRARLDDLVAEGVAHKVVDEAGLAEADLCLGWMHIHVNFFGRQLEEEQDDRKGCGRQDISIGIRDRVQEQAVAHEAAIDEGVDGVAIELFELGLGGEAGEPQMAGDGRLVIFILLPRGRCGQADALEIDFGSDGEQVVEGFLAEDLEDAVRGLGDRRRLQERVGGGVQLEVLVGMGERVMSHQSCYV